MLYATKKSLLTGMPDRKLPFPAPLQTVKGLSAFLLKMRPRHAFNVKEVSKIMQIYVFGAWVFITWMKNILGLPLSDGWHRWSVKYSNNWLCVYDPLLAHNLPSSPWVITQIAIQFVLRWSSRDTEEQKEMEIGYYWIIVCEVISVKLMVIPLKMISNNGPTLRSSYCVTKNPIDENWSFSFWTSNSVLSLFDSCVEGSYSRWLKMMHRPICLDFQFGSTLKGSYFGSTAL